MAYRTEPKSETVLVREDARDLARAKVRTLTRRITDHIYVEIDKLFEQAELDDADVTRVDLDDCIQLVAPQVKGWLDEG